MEEERTKILCNRCGTSTFHRLLTSKVIWGWFEEGPVPDDVPDHPDEADWSDAYELFQCCGCDDVCLRHLRFDRDMPDDGPREPHYYPPRLFRRRPNWFSALRRDLAALLDEVYSALAGDSRRLAVMGARAVIDMVLADKVGDQGSFFEKLEALESKGFVGRANREQLAAALDVGSAAAHRGHAPSVEDLAHVMDIVENLLNSAYLLDDAARGLRRNTPRRYPRGV